MAESKDTIDALAPATDESALITEGAIEFISLLP
jgi:hypothetical protein